MLEKTKLSSTLDSITIKANIELSGKGTEKYPLKRFYDHYCLDGHLGIDDWNFTLFEQCEVIYPFGLVEKEEYLY